MIKIRRLNFIGLIFTIALFEGLALLFLALFGYGNNNSLLERALIGLNSGFLTGFIALSLYNNIKFLKIKFYDKNKLFAIDRISALRFGVINGIYLMFLTAVNFFTVKLKVNFLYTILAEGIVVFIAVYLLIAFYNFFIKRTNFTFWFNNKKVKIKHIGFGMVVAVSLFEIFILPPILFLMGYASNILNYFVFGLISGIAGSIATILAYNFIFSKVIPIEIET